ncbi:DUF1641 domain-containing protein [Nocardioides humi]|uniref:DUF1641 domain-containing protein n=1 Tax=Nocardioides humi TaxID=449461 RepID=A0ABN2A4E6_9ACTN|nr:DUF1641 domain-containing protein [Nocardioides humi]
MVQPQTSIGMLRERLDDPQVAAALNNLLDHADLLAILLVGLDGFVGRTETIGEAIAEGLADIRGVAASNPALESVDPGEILASVIALSTAMPKLTPAVTRVVDAGLIDDVLDSGIVSTEMVDQIARIGRGLTAGAERAEKEPVEVKGLLSLMKLLKDPDIQRAIAYMAAVAKSIGIELDSQPRG